MALRDLSGRKQNEERINYLAHHDALTGALNRAALHDRLALETELASERNGQLVLLYLDLDRFKPVNDVLGHAAGDHVLLQVSKRIKATLAPSDLLARVGGDEFVVVIIRPISLDDVSRLATNIAASLQAAFRVNGDVIDLAASIGIALYPTDGKDVEGLLRAADTAMYQAKAERKGSFCLYQPKMNQKLQDRRELEQELSMAIRRGQLELFYQPMVNGRDGSVETYEALIRWRHPVKGMISPADFIPLAEQSGLIDPIGEWVIDTACRSAARWPHPWRVSINVSPSQFAKSDVASVIASALARHDLPPSRLVVEITEAVFIADTTQAVATLSKLRDLGIRLALDDFGTGYSSLSYLQSFKFDKFKIDQSFVRRLSDGAEPLTIIKAIVNLGHNLGLQVTAEGVETLEQATLLRSLGCDQMQGYFFGRPAALNVEGLPDRIEARFAA